MTEYTRLYARQTDADVSLFRVEDDTGKFVLRPDLRQIACSRCGKCDEMNALHHGAYNRVAITVNQDFVASWEYFPIVSAKLKEFLDEIGGSSVAYFETDSADYFIALPTHVILPDASGNSFQASNKCALCGRYSELLWGSTPATINSPFAVGVFHLENRMGITPVWVVCNELSRALTKAIPKFRGIVKDPLADVPNGKR